MLKFNSALLFVVVAALSAILLLVSSSTVRAADGEAHADDPNILHLTDNNFDEEISKIDVAFVEFYAGFCGHCKALAPKLIEAAKKLAEDAETKDNYKIVQVDAEKESKTSGRFKVTGYPTIKIFRQGEMTEEYEGGRTADEIVAFLKKRGQVAVNKELKTPKEFKEATKVANMNGPRVVGVFASKDSVDYKYFKAVALSFAASGLEVFHTATPAVLEDIGFYGSGSAIHVYRPFAKPNKVTFKGTVFKQDLQNFIADNILPADAVAEYNENNGKLFQKTGDSIVRIVSEGNVPAVTAVLNAVVKNKELSTKTEIGNIRFATSKWSEYEKEALKECGDAAKDSKVCVLGTYGKNVKGKAGSTYGMEGAFSAAAFDKFLDRFIKQQLKAKLKSEAAPSEPAKAGVVNVVVGSTFEDEVLNNNKQDSFIFFKASWCGWCKKAAPIVDELAQKLADKFDQVTIQSFDADANEMSPAAKAVYQVSGFPTFYYAKKGAKLTPKKYEGGRELADFQKYIEEQLK